MFAMRIFISDKRQAIGGLESRLNFASICGRLSIKFDNFNVCEPEAESRLSFSEIIVTFWKWKTSKMYMRYSQQDVRRWACTTTQKKSIELCRSLSLSLSLSVFLSLSFSLSLLLSGLHLHFHFHLQLRHRTITFGNAANS